MKKVILLVLILMFSCKKKKVDRSHNKVEVKADVLGDSLESKQEKEFEKQEYFVGEVKYVIAKSGLIYRDKPKGKRLGRFDFNEEITITEHSNIFQEIKSGNQIIKGEWVGVKLNNKTVYIFDGFISDEKIKITVELVEEFMGNNIWVSQDFKDNLEGVKSYGEAFYYGYSLQLQFSNTKDVFGYSESEPILLGYLVGEQDNTVVPLDNIVDINYESMTVTDGSNDYVFFNNYNNTVYDLYENWFKGVYSFEDENGIRKYNSKAISYNFDLDIDYFLIDEKIYRVDDINDSTFDLSEIKFTESEKEDEKWEYGGDSEYDLIIIKETGKGATLTKIE